MAQVTVQERVDTYWSRALGVDVDHLHTPGVHVCARPPHRVSWRGVYVLALDDGACVVVPDDLLDTVTAAVHTTTPDAGEVLAAHTWQRLLGARVQGVSGPVVHHYLDRTDGLGELSRGRRINPDDAKVLAQLRASVTEQEWASAGFDSQPAVLFGLFEGDQMVAAANLTAGPEGATDIGIVLRPDARGQGYGVRIAAVAAQQALSLHGIARFRALATSQPTLAIAAKLGFQEYGRNSSITLAP